MTTLASRICAYLDRNASQWVAAPLIYSIASKHGYRHDDIKRALSDVAHTPPYATWSVMDGDHHAQRQPGVGGKGVYYKRQPCTPSDLAFYKRQDEAWDSL